MLRLIAARAVVARGPALRSQGVVTAMIPGGGLRVTLRKSSFKQTFRQFSAQSGVSVGAPVEAIVDVIDKSKNDGTPTSELVIENFDKVQDAVDVAVSIPSQVPSDVQLGFWPSDFVVRGITSLHEYVGLPWWGSILVATMVIRFSLLPVQIKMRQSAGNASKAMPELQALKARYIKPNMTPADQLMFRKESREIYAKYNFNPFATLGGVLSQLVIFMSFFFGVKKLPLLYPSLAAGGAFWFPDLTLPDAYYVLPAITASTFFMTIHMAPEPQAGDGTNATFSPDQMKKIMSGLAIATFPLTMNFSSALALYWSSSNTFTLVQNLLLQTPAVKKALNLPDSPKPTPAPGQVKSKGLFELMQEQTRAIQQADTASASTSNSVPDISKFTNEVRDARNRRNKKRSGK